MPLSPPPVKSAIFRTSEGAVVDEYRFQFNPTKFKQSRKVAYYKSNTLGQYLPAAQFLRFSATSWSLDLLLYGKYGEIDVEKEVARLELFVSPGPAFNFNFPQFVSPGRAKLVWGKWVFNIVFDGMDFDHFMFSKQGIPIATRVNLKFTPVSGGLKEDLVILDRLRSISQIGG